jgi:hypothetical protein
MKTEDVSTFFIKNYISIPYKKRLLAEGSSVYGLIRTLPKDDYQKMVDIILKLSISSGIELKLK